MTQKENLICLILEYDWDETEYGAEQFAEYLLDNGVVVMPCKVGDTVYSITSGQVSEMNVSGVYPNGLIVKNKLCNFYLTSRYTYQCSTVFDIGKTIFFTREEAEAAVKETEEKA